MAARKRVRETQGRRVPWEIDIDGIGLAQLDTSLQHRDSLGWHSAADVGVADAYAHEGEGEWMSGALGASHHESCV